MSENVSVNKLFLIDPLDTTDIPSELIKELALSDSKAKDAQILNLLDISGRPLSLDELLVGCFRQYNVIHKRNILVSRIFRLIKKGLVQKTGKGKYSIIIH